MSSKGWKTVTASEYCIKVADGTHDSPKRTITGKPLITSKHIKGKSIDFDSAYLISEDDYKKINLRSQVNQWDVLISMIGEYCGYCYVETNETISYAVKNVGIFKVGDRVKAYWLFYYLKGPKGKELLQSLRAGTSQPYISLGALRTLSLQIPEKRETMSNIVSILSSLDDKIELNRQINLTFEAIAQALFKEWFVVFNFPEATGEMCESELGRIPKNWKIGKLGDEGDFKNGINYSRDEQGDTEFSIINVRDVVENKFLSKSVLDTIKINKKKATPYLLKAEDIIIVRSASPGETAIILNQEENIIYSGFTIRYRLYEKHYFLYYFFVFQNLKKTFDNLSNGTTLKNINQEMLKNYTVILPENKIISEFNSVIEPIFEKILSINKEMKILNELRDTLLPKLLNGEILII